MFYKTVLREHATLHKTRLSARPIAMGSRARARGVHFARPRRRFDGFCDGRRTTVGTRAAPGGTPREILRDHSRPSRCARAKFAHVHHGNCRESRDASCPRPTDHRTSSNRTNDPEAIFAPVRPPPSFRYSRENDYSVPATTNSLVANALSGRTVESSSSLSLSLSLSSVNSLSNEIFSRRILEIYVQP